MHELKTKELIALLEIHNKYKTDNSGKIHISPRLLTRNSNNYGKFKIVGVSDKKYKDHKLFIIEFLDTHYRGTATLCHINNGKVKDYYKKSLCNIGYLGDNYIKIKKNDPVLCKKLYEKWNAMIQRCYRGTHPEFYKYGEKGVRVCDRWLCFSLYYKDVTKLRGYNRDLVIHGKLSLDKDKLQQDKRYNEKIYSSETCCWLSTAENNSYIDVKSSYFVVTHPDNSISIEYNINKFARNHKLRSSNINKCLKGYRNHAGNYRFRYATNEEINLYIKNH